MSERERIDPSKEAIEAAFDEYTADRNLVKSYVDNVKSILKTAYAIDFAQLQVERDQLRTDLRHATARTEQLAIEAGEAIGQAKRLREDLQESQQKVKELEVEQDRLDDMIDRLKDDIVRFGGEGVVLRHESTKQQTIIQELAEALREVLGENVWSADESKFFGSVRRVIQGAPSLLQADAALASASPWLRKEGEG